MAFITVAGENWLAAKQGAGLVADISHFVFANVPNLGVEPISRIELLPSSGNIVLTKEISKKGYANKNVVVYSVTLDSTIGDFDFNWVGLKSADGVLVAVIHLSDIIAKIKSNGTVAGNNITRNFAVQFSGIQALTAIDVPVETWQIDFTTRLLQIDERERLSNFDIYGDATVFENGGLVTNDPGNTFYVEHGTGYVGGIRVTAAVNEVLTIPNLPKSVWLDVSLQGDINGVDAVFPLIVSATDLANYTDSLGFEHYVTKLADIDANGTVTDRRNVKKTAVNTAFFQTFLDNPVRNAVLSFADTSISLITSAWVKNGFTYSFNYNNTSKVSNSYIRLPFWMGGIIIQWGHVPDGTANNQIITANFPIPFPSSCNFCALLGTAGVALDSVATEGAEVVSWDNTSFTVVSAWTGNPSGGNGFGVISDHASYPAMPWVAIGR